MQIGQHEVMYIDERHARTRAPAENQDDDATPMPHTSTDVLSTPFDSNEEGDDEYHDPARTHVGNQIIR